MTKADTADRPSEIIDMRMDILVRVAFLGIALGIVAWVLTTVLNRFVIIPSTCNTSSAAGICKDSLSFAGNTALILSSIAGVLGLVRLGVYRPMLIALAVVVCLWGLAASLKGVVWYESIGWTGLMYMIAYVAFAWFVRPRNFVIAVVTTAIIIGVARYVATL